MSWDLAEYPTAVVVRNKRLGIKLYVTSSPVEPPAGHESQALLDQRAAGITRRTAGEWLLKRCNDHPEHWSDEPQNPRYVFYGYEHDAIKIFLTTEND